MKWIGRSDALWATFLLLSLDHTSSVSASLRVSFQSVSKSEKMLIFIFVALLLTWIYLSTRKPKNFPPGPPRLPMLGSLPFMTGSGSSPSLLHGIIDQVKAHGPIVGFYFGKTPAVVLADYKLVRGWLFSLKLF